MSKSRGLAAIVFILSILSVPVRWAAADPPSYLSATSRDSAFGVYLSHMLSQRFMQAEGFTEKDMFSW